MADDDVVDPPVFQGEKGALKAWNGVIAFFKKFRKPDGTTYGPTDFVFPIDLAQGLDAARKHTDDAGALVSAFMQKYTDDAIAAALTGGATKPGAPTITSVTPAVVLGIGQITVAFADGGDGGSAITDHIVRLYAGGFILSGIPLKHGATSPITVTALNPAVKYTATVSAINTIGEGAESAPSDLFQAGATIPQAPTLTSVSPSGTGVDAFITLAGTFAHPGDGGSPITNITATAVSSDGGTTRSTTVAIGFTFSPIHIANLTVGKHYTVTAVETNIIGNSPASTPSASFLVGTLPTINAAQSQLGMFTNEPDHTGVRFMRANEALLGRRMFAVQINFSPAPGGTDNVWGCTSDAATVDSVDGVSKCLGYDTMHGRVQAVLDTPIAVGGPSDGFGNGFGLSAAQKITRLNNIENGTYDGTNSSDDLYRLAAKAYYRDRNIFTSLTSGSNAVDVSTFAGSGTLHVADTSLHASSSAAAGHDLFVDLGAGHGVVTVSYTGKTSTTFTGCTYTGRAGVGGGTGSTILATGGYVGSGTGWADFVGRIGWEGDGDWFAWGSTKPTTYWNGSAQVPDNTATQAALSTQWLATYKYVVDLFRGFGWDTFKADLTFDPGFFQKRLNDVLTPLLGAGPTADGAGRYVDSLGLDVYDQDQSNGYDPTTRTWVDPAGAWNKFLVQLNQWLTIARNAGLPISFGEWAAVSNIPAPSVSGGDNPTFIQGMYNFQSALTAGWGAGQLAFHTYFDSNNEGGNFALNTNKPNARNRFISLFGA